MASGHGGGMLRTILIWVAISIAVILLLLWLLSGGVGKITQAAQGIANPFSYFFGSSSSTAAFRLPWQPDMTSFGADLSQTLDSEGGSSQSPEEQLSSLQDEYDALNAKANEAKTFGTPSPYRGKVRISEGYSASGSGEGEYVGIAAGVNNTTPVDITGWSFQSALTGVRGFIPRGASLFLMGSVNPQTDIYLNPGDEGIVSSGSSPLGTSFRENICTGYLEQLQSFNPRLESNCPPPSESFPETADNLRTYGEVCFDFVRSLPSCTYPLSMPTDASPSCRTFLSNNLSYNGCVQNYQHTSGFARQGWRIYLGAGGELWRNTHDIIRLLDTEGRTVDVFTY